MIKKQLRNHFLSLRNQLFPKQREEESLAVTNQLISSTFWREAQTISLYLAFGSELSTSHLVKQAWQENKTIVIPKILSKTTMEMVVFKENMTLTKNHYGIDELVYDNQNVIIPSLIDLMLLPALACDYQGTRLGYGGGYYDRYLEKCSKLVKIGLIYHDCYLDDKLLPKNDTDISLDYLVTCKGLKKIKNKH